MTSAADRQFGFNKVKAGGCDLSLSLWVHINWITLQQGMSKQAESDKGNNVTMTYCERSVNMKLQPAPTRVSMEITSNGDRSIAVSYSSS